MRSINVNTATKRLAHIRQLNRRQTTEKARERRTADILRRDLSCKRERALIIMIRDPLTEKEYVPLPLGLVSKLVYQGGSRVLTFAVSGKPGDPLT